MSQEVKVDANGEDDANSADTTSPNLRCAELSARFQLHGWQPDPTLSDDENYMDLVMLVTRNSICLQGYMGCVIVNPNLDTAVTKLTDTHVDKDNPNNKTLPSDNSSVSTQQRQRQQQQQQIYHNIIGASTNLPLFSKADSDIHAEIGALGQCNKYGNSTKGAIAYITMPPCKRCFAALLSAGVTKIVAQQRHPDVILRTAQEHGITMVDMGIDYKAKQHTRVEQLISSNNEIEDGDENNANNVELRKQLLHERRKRRKEQRQAKKHAKIERRSHFQTMHEHTNALKSNTQKDTNT